MADRVGKIGCQECFITIKDHKSNFPSKVDYRLINPARSQIGKIAKDILQRIISEVKVKTGLNQWNSSNEAIEWFKTIDNNANTTFFQFDIDNFYPSITYELFLKAIEWAKKFTYIADSSVDIILHASKSILWHKGEPWVKKHYPNFDVTQGSYHGAQMSDLAGLYLLSLLTCDNVTLMPGDGARQNLESNKPFKTSDGGLYRDDSLFKVDGDGHTVDKMRKRVTEIMKNEGLSRQNHVAPY